MASARFSYRYEALQEIAAAVIRRAADKGASASEAEVSESYGQTVTVRMDQVETIIARRPSAAPGGAASNAPAGKS